MKRFHFSLSKTVAAMTIAGCLFVFSSNAQDKTKTITGEVLDMTCYMSSGAHGDGHKECAATCIKGGSPIGLLTSDGKVYLLVENHDKKEGYAQARTHAGEQITVTGTVSEKAGVQGIVVNEVKGKG